MLRKSFCKILYIFYFIAVTFAQKNAFAQLKKELTIATDIFCPYVCDNKESPGYFVELLQKAFGYSDIHIKIKYMPKYLMLKELEESKVDAIIGISKQEESSTLIVEKSGIDTTFNIYGKSSINWAVADINILRNRKIGINSRFFYNEDVQMLLYSKYMRGKIDIFTSTGIDASISNIVRLLNNEVVAIIDNKLVMNYKMKNEDLPIKSIGNIKNESKKIYVGFISKDPDALKYASILNQNISFMESVGEVEKLIHKYILPYEN